MGSATWQFIAGIGSGVTGGALAGMFGVGGAIVLIPLLAFFLHLDQHRAQGLALAALLLPNGLPAVLHYRRRGVPLHIPLVGFLTVGFLAGIWMGALFATHLPESWLRQGFIGLLVFLSVKTFFLQEPEVPELEAMAFPRTGQVWLPGIWIGLVGGMASGLLGIGGAILMNPLMAWRLRLPQHQVQLTSLALMLFPIGLPGVIVYTRAQRGLPWVILLGVALGFMFGAYGGARLAVRMKGPKLRMAFATLMLLMALLLLFR